MLCHLEEKEEEEKKINSDQAISTIINDGFDFPLRSTI